MLVVCSNSTRSRLWLACRHLQRAGQPYIVVKALAADEKALQDVQLLTMLLAQTCLAIHLISRHIDEALDGASHACCLKHDMCAICVVHGERQAVTKAVVHMRLQTRESSSAGQSKVSASSNLAAVLLSSQLLIQPSQQA